MSELSFNDSLKLPLPESKVADGERFLVFSLGDNKEAVISIENLQGVVQIDLNEILPIPETPQSLLGILSWRGEAIWSLDLAQYLGENSFLSAEEKNTKVFGAITINQKRSLALLVKQLTSIAVHNSEKNLLPMTAGMVSPETARFLQGYFLKSDGVTPQFLLNLDVIFEILE